MRQRTITRRFLGKFLLLGICVAAAFTLRDSVWTANAQGKPVEARMGEYAKPRHPRPVKISSIDDLMPYARAAARNRASNHGMGLGALQPGDSVLLLGDLNSEEMAVEAVLRALGERKVRAEFKYDFELLGVSRDDMQAYRKATGGGWSRANKGWSIASAEHGYGETAGWVRNIRDESGKSAGEAWLRQRRPDLAAKLFPAPKAPSTPVQLPANLQEVRRKLEGQRRLENPLGPAILDYLAKNKMRGVFWGNGGPVWLEFPGNETKFLGLFTQDQETGLVHDQISYPADIWMLAEEQTLDPLAFIERVEVVDPEGTNAWFDLTVDQANRWAKGAFVRGHLFLFPQQGFGRHAESRISHKEFGDFVPNEPMVLLNGVLAGIRGHGGFYPRMELHYKDGYLTDVKGGGLVGETLREFLQHYPEINEAVYPFYKRPGYFFQYEIAMATQPKAPWSMETRRAGLVHFGLGKEVRTDPDSPIRAKSARYEEYARKHKLPADHGFHMHNYFLTYKARLRGSDRWTTLNDRGRLASLDSPEVRALASRYGNPDELLKETWIPEVPGINVPGDYQAYAADPYRHHKGVEDRITSGTYEYFGPPSPKLR